MKSRFFLLTNCLLSALTVALFTLCILGVSGSGTSFDWWIAVSFAVITATAWLSYAVENSTGAIVCAFLICFSALLPVHILSRMSEQFINWGYISENYPTLILKIGGYAALAFFFLYILAVCTQKTKEETLYTPMGRSRSVTFFIANLLTPALANSLTIPFLQMYVIKSSLPLPSSMDLDLQDNLPGDALELLIMSRIFLLFLVTVVGWVTYSKRKHQGAVACIALMLYCAIIEFAFVFSLDDVIYIPVEFALPVLMYLIAYFRQKRLEF